MKTLPDNGCTPVNPASSAGAHVHAPAMIYTVAGLPPDMPATFPAVILWRDWHMPEQSPFSVWPPKHKPQFGQCWVLDGNKNLAIETTIETKEKFYAFVFLHWGCRPCGQSKVTGYREPDGTHQVFGDSAR